MFRGLDGLIFRNGRGKICYCLREQDSNRPRIALLFLIPISRLVPLLEFNRCGKPRNYSVVAPERCLKISTAILSASRCLSNADISTSIRAIVAINPPSTIGGATGGSLLGLADNS